MLFPIHSGTIAKYHLKKRPVAVKGCRKLTKRDMKHNDALPVITVDPETYRVRLTIFRFLIGDTDLSSSWNRLKLMENSVPSVRLPRYLSLKITCSSRIVLPLCILQSALLSLFSCI